MTAVAANVFHIGLSSSKTVDLTIRVLIKKSGTFYFFISAPSMLSSCMEGNARLVRALCEGEGRLASVSGLFRLNQTNQTNHTDQMNQIDRPPTRREMVPDYYARREC
jgi:hypothetical protein